MVIKNIVMPFPFNNRLLSLLWVSVVVLFTSLPCHSDLSFMAITVASLATFAAWKSNVSLKGELKGDGQAIFIAFLSYVFVVIVTSFLNPLTILNSSRVIIWASCLWAGYIVARLFPKHGFVFVRGLVAALVISFVVLLPLGYLQGDASEYYTAYRLELLTGHPSRLALFCVLGFFYCLYEGVQRRAGQNWPWIVCSVVLITIIVLTNTRALMLFFPVTVLLYAFIALRRRAWLIACVVLIGIVIAAGVVVANKESPSSKRLISLIKDLPNDPTFQTRLPIWEAGWWAFTQSPIVGNGLKSYRSMHKTYEKAHSVEWELKYPKYEKSVKHSHNIVLGRLVETGVLGTIAFFTMYCFALLRLLRGPKKDHWVTSFLVFYLLIGLVDDPLYRVNDSFLLFLFGTVAGRPSIKDS